LTQQETISIPLTFANQEAVFVDQPFAVAAPFAMGAIRTTQEIALKGTSACTIEATGFWPDKSIKWCVVKGMAIGVEGRPPSLTLEVGGAQLSSAGRSGITVAEEPEGLEVSTGEVLYKFVRKEQQFFPDVFSHGSKLLSGQDFAIDFNSGGVSDYVIDYAAPKLVSCGAASAVVGVDAVIVLSSERRLNLKFRFEILGGQWIRVGVQVHNAHRARHAASLWDLGDEGSISFSELSLRIARKDKQRVSWKPEHQFEREQITNNAVLFQASSGGRHWDSPTHIDASGNVPNLFRGYRVEVDGKAQASGDRASPIVWVEENAEQVFGFVVREYWQNFPKSLEVNDGNIKVGLFPVQHGGDHELQGGERKQHELVFSIGSRDASFHWVDEPSVLAVSAEYLAETRVLRYKECGGRAVESLGYRQLLSEAHEANGFLAKREQIDEFGWRNFGEVFADHETLYNESDGVFVSHYNNQYDAIYGFARQYLITGDARWYRLMVDLARHVIDIDIYRTEEDRAEYNHGLFWHSDHYKQAHTSTHRTYTRSNYPAELTTDMGGGPGSEHCYTSGLLLYYFLTGDMDARDSVLGLTTWISNYYEGTGTLLEVGKKLATEDRYRAVALCKGHRVFRYQYGLDRGVGNYVRALIDSYKLTFDQEYLDRAEKVIQGTFNCSDDIAERRLQDIEGTWYYTIFLQDVITYLDLKRTLNQLDSGFAHARDALLHYAYWMVENEAPYLDKPEQLEFPNDTWVAQDIRKANVLYAAYRYAVDDREKLLSRSRYFRDYVINELTRSNTRHFSRIQIILLQNHGPSDLMDVESKPYVALEDLPEESSDLNCFHTPAGFLGELFGTWGRALINFRPGNELKWMKARVG